MKFFLTGGAGFVGSHVADALREQNHHVMIYDNFSTGKMSNVVHLTDSGLVEISEGDITDMPNLTKILIAFKPDIIIHLAAQSAITTSMTNPIKDLLVNAAGTLNLLKLASRLKVKRFIFSSTSAVYARPTGLRKFRGLKESDLLGPDTPYGISKLAAESYIRTMFCNHVICRFGNVYGPRQVSIGENQVVPRAISHIMNGTEFFIHGSGKQTRDFVYVGDVAQAIIKAISGRHGTYNIATGKSHSVNEITKHLTDRMSLPGFEWKHTDEEDQRHAVRMDVSAALDGLGWEAKMPFAEGIAKTLQWHGRQS